MEGKRGRIKKRRGWEGKGRDKREEEGMGWEGNFVVLKAFTVLAVMTHHLLHVLLEPAILSSETRRLQLFQQHFEERIMGLLGALIPDVSKVLLTVCTITTVQLMCVHDQFDTCSSDRCVQVTVSLQCQEVQLHYCACNRIAILCSPKQDSTMLNI